MPFPLLLSLLLGFVPAAAQAFGFDDVARRAEKLAGRAYQAPEEVLPEALRELSYDQYRAIRFKPDRALWRGTALPFEVQFFHPGFFYQHPVRINLVGADGVREHRFDPEAFSYGELKLERKDLKKLGYAGFRIHYPINKPDYKDEIAVFLGASYLRAVGRGQGYGLSARGLAVDTALPSGEEFPAFREFWIEWPAPEAAEIVVYALLDSPRATGAYRFLIRPGVSTVMDVRARLFLREAVGRLGLAPLTSMYFSGENQRAPVEDYRPEVHDSDGLSIHAAEGNWIWRPLANPKRLLVTSFALKDPRGFGLMQRDRSFASYEDLESRFELRPSAWVEPLDDWGAGRVELVQIPTSNEFNDNIVAFWVPDALPAPRKPLDLRYRLSWQMKDAAQPPTSRVTQTRRGFAGEDNERLRFVVDFEGPALDALKDVDHLDPGVSLTGPGEVMEQRAYRNAAAGGFRVVLEVRRKEDDGPIELRAQLRGADGKPLSEAWSHIVPAP